MILSNLKKLWQFIVSTMDEVVQKVFDYGRSGAWFRFLLIPIVAGLAFLFYRQITGLFESILNSFFIDTQNTSWNLGDFSRWVMKILFSENLLAPPQVPIWRRILNGVSRIGVENLQIALLGVLAFWLAYRFVSRYVFQLYGPMDYRQAKHMISSIFIPFRRRKIVISKGKEIPGKNISIHEMYGEQITLFMDAQDGYAAVLERADHSIRIVGPQDKFPVYLDGFMHLRQVVDLNDQHVRVTSHSHTREGIPISAHGVGFICRLSGVEKVPEKEEFISCDLDTVRRLTYHHWLGPEWENPVKRQKALYDMISTSLGTFIMQQNIVEFLTEMGDFVKFNESINKIGLFQKFAEYFTEGSGEHGLELVWTGKGEWQLSDPKIYDVIGVNYRQAIENWQRSQAETINLSGIAEYNQEVQVLVQRLTRAIEESRKIGDPFNETLKQLSHFYMDQIRNACRILHSRGENPPEDWIQTLNHLEHWNP